MADFEDSNSRQWSKPDQGPGERQGRRSPAPSPLHRTARPTNSMTRSPRCRSVRGAGTSTRSTSLWTANASLAALFDFRVSFFHNAREQIARGAGPFYYLPKLESHLEARLSERHLLPGAGRTRHTAWHHQGDGADRDHTGHFRTRGILYELRQHSAGLNAGRWDYIFSCIKKFKRNRDFCLATAAPSPWKCVHAQLCPGLGQGLS